MITTSWAADAPVSMAINAISIIMDMNGSTGRMLIDPDAQTTTMGADSLVRWCEDRRIPAQITGPIYTRFEYETEEHMASWQTVIGYNVQVHTRITWHRTEDEIRYGEDLECETNVYRVRRMIGRDREELDYARLHLLDSLRHRFGGLPGDCRTVETSRHRLH